MKKTIFRSICFALILFASTVTGQPVYEGGPIINTSTVATLPTGIQVGHTRLVTDGSTGSDCTVGGGANLVLCRYNGTAWVSIGGGGFDPASPGAIGATTPAAGSFTNINAGKADGTAGGNITIYATLGTQKAPALTEGNWTVGAGWESPIVGPGLIKNADGTGTQTPSAATNIVAGTTYKVIITLSALTVGSASYTVGGVTGTSLAAATTYTDYITALTTGKLIITPTNTSRFTISAISIKPLTDATGDVTIEGNLTVRSPATFNGRVWIPSGSGDAPGLSFSEPYSGEYSGFLLGAYGGISISLAGLASKPAYFFTGSGFFIGSGLQLGGGSGMQFGWTTAASPYGSALDVILERDAANILALKNLANAQSFRIYTSYTDASNYERLGINTAAGAITLAAETLGSGTDNVDLVLAPAGTGLLKIGTNAAAAAGVASTHKIAVKDGAGATYYLLVTNVP